MTLGGRAGYLGRVYTCVTRRLFADRSTFAVYKLRLSNTKDIDYSASLDSSVTLAPQRHKNGRLLGRDIRRNTFI